MSNTPFKFNSPTNIMVAGPSGSGKTRLVQELVTNNLHLFTEKPSTIHYCYGSYQPLFDSMKKKGVVFHKGVSKESDLDKWFPKGGILVMDDMMAEAGDDKAVVDIFTRHSHHRNITTIYLCQDLFPGGNYSKTISRNAHYVVIFKNPRDKTGVRAIMLQAFPDNFRNAMDAFKIATKRPYGYLVLDLHPSSDDEKPLVSYILDKEGHTRMYKID